MLNSQRYTHRRLDHLPNARAQAQYIFGYGINMGSSTRLQDYLAQYLGGIHNLRWQEFIMGVVTMMILVFFKVGVRRALAA